MEQLLIHFLNAVTPVARRFVSRRREAPNHNWSIGEAVAPQRSVSSGSVTLSPDQLRRHAYILGASGSGKTKAMELLIRAHLQNDLGFALVDPHGDLTRAVVAYVASQQASLGHDALDRIYLVEPFTDDVIGMNVLDPGDTPLYPHISELIGIFRRLWASSWGPRMEEIFRNALLVLARSGHTIVQVPQLLTDPVFRSQALIAANDPVLRAYWSERYDALSDAARLTYAEPVLNKVGALIADPRLRAMLGECEQCLDFRQLMDSGAWIILNVAKGQLRDASYLLGSLATAQIQAAAMSRANIPEAERRPFTLFVDEFQNFRGEDFETILCEARKYGLRLVIAHQFLAQLDPVVQSAIFGNIATQLLFAVSPPDAAALGRLLSGETVRPEALVQLPVGQAVLHQRGQAAQHVAIHPVLTPPIPESEMIEFAASLRRRHARPLDECKSLPFAAVNRNPRRKTKAPAPTQRQATADDSQPLPPVVSGGTVSEAADD